ncbi:transcription factor GTE4 isoform X1 [Brachypodium distachyon]|uniref:Bromo domain-containing protein n=1 Tax=Brachypodium distachyon TaxID=15368 RepID=A0A0Q3GEX7_BRADI|nr:transcription factor GTE4 isoform X1 [Brachypodium distachyon]KQK08973.1 hypothetical protein BRADI_2g45190v3 [Brachypodium distachyon]|eukprot:XP_003566942.2 transcription factor GTE4 isoform X1 [Brachypodium distachyon]
MPRRKLRDSPLPRPGFAKKPKNLADADPGHARAFDRCRELLDQLLQHDDAWVFDKPVDVYELGISDYYTMIPDPMDLGTVSSRLNRLRYADPRAFAEDVRLTFRNAMTFNDEDDAVYKSAAELSRIFESGWASILVELTPPQLERNKKLKEEMTRLPASWQGKAVAIMKEIGGCLQEVNRWTEVDFDKADEATLDKLEQLVAYATETAAVSAK